MTTPLRIGIIGDYDATSRSHRATDAALGHAADRLGISVDAAWLPTPSLDPLPHVSMQEFDALWCAPGSPYQSMSGALNAIRFARETERPFLGTCGGFQHAVIEYARNVVGIADAQHAEYDPATGSLLVTPLSCSLVGQTLRVAIEPDSRAGRAYGQTQALEQYYCTFGLNPDYRARLHDGGLRIVGTDQDGDVRIVELPHHPFFIGTLFVPQLTSTLEQPHPLIMAYLEAAGAVSRAEAQPGGSRLAHSG